MAVMFFKPVISIILESAPSLSNLLYRFMRDLTFYMIILCLIVYAGDDIYRWAFSHLNYDSILEVTIAFAICLVFFHVGGGLFRVPVSSLIEPGTPAASVFFKPSSRDNRYIAAHEAGHALVYAALGNDLPADTRLVINNYSVDKQAPLGFITGVSRKHCLNEKTFAEWEMLILLAGKSGEVVMYGSSVLGSDSDYMKWLNVARGYLANYYRGIYYVVPQNKFEQEQNEVKLEALRYEQLAMLNTLFDMNINVFRHLANTLLEARTMDRNNLISFLSRVNLPEGFPLPFADKSKAIHACA